MNLPMVEEHGVGQQAIWRSWSGEVFNVGKDGLSKAGLSGSEMILCL